MACCMELGDVVLKQSHITIDAGNKTAEKYAFLFLNSICCPRQKENHIRLGHTAHHSVKVVNNRVRQTDRQKEKERKKDR